MLSQVFVQNDGEIGGSGGNGAFGDPSAVTDGVIAFFDEAGNSIDLSSNSISDYSKLQIVRGETYPRISSLLDGSKITVNELAYAAPAKQVATVDIGTISQDDYLTIRTDNREQGYEPRDRRSYEIEALSGDSEADLIDKFVDAINSREDSINGYEGSSVYAGTDQTVTVEIDTFNGGDTETVTIDGTDYTETLDTDEATTHANFVASHADSIRSTHGLRVEVDGNDDLLFTMVEGNLDLTSGGDFSASADGSSSVTVTYASAAPDLLRLEAKEFGQIFDVGYYANDDSTSWSPTVTVDTTYAEGNGSYEQVKSFEESVFGNLGRYVQDDGILGRQEDPEVFAVKGNTYDIIVLRHPNDNDANINPSFEYQDIVLALETDLTKTQINNFLGTSL